MNNNNRRWGLACVESLQGHVISPSLAHGWHLMSRGLRAFLAQLVAPFSSSGLDLRATAHIQRPAPWPFSARVWGVGVVAVLFTAYYGEQPLTLAPAAVLPTAVLVEQMVCSGHVK